MCGQRIGSTGVCSSKTSVAAREPSYIRPWPKTNITRSDTSESYHDQPKLTDLLLAVSPDRFRKATQHTFLEHAGKGTLSKHDLSRWLSQDRLYAETYISFISSLIARVRLPVSFVTDKNSSLEWCIVNLLTFSLENIHRELKFFTDTAQKYTLRLDQPYAGDTFAANEVTERYMSLFRSFQLQPEKSLLEGILVLWATEKCYLEAWTSAKSAANGTKNESHADGRALQLEFIPNWTCPEFAQFVEDIASILDELASESEQLNVEELTAIWLQVLDIEKDFWPDIDDM